MSEDRGGDIRGPGAGSLRPSEERPILRVRDLRTWFSTEHGIARAVDGVSFDVRRGRTLGVVGESGSGKSVTALSILGLLPRSQAVIQAGSRIDWRDEELTSAGEARLREIRGNEIAMIFQEPMTSLNPVMRVGEQIGEALAVHRGLRGAALRREVEALLDRVGIPAPEDRVGAYPHQLSGGMRQRVMIAMALSCRPDLLIADEPTTALDVTIQAQILDLLRSLQTEFGMAVVLITHDLGVVSEMADDVVVMYAGQVVERGPVRELMDRPQHPYTEALLGSLPDLDRRRGRLAVIPGAVPRATAWPPACRFHPRCRHAWERCRRHMPELQGSARHGFRCWLADEPARRRTSGLSGRER
jgi:oligopeptide/dipeptide ABC transporter ATP-binding protein